MKWKQGADEQEALLRVKEIKQGCNYISGSNTDYSMFW